MSIDIPSTLQGFVNDEIASGAFGSEAELVVAALATFQEMKRRHRSLKDSVSQSLSQRDQGLASSVNFSAVKEQIRDAAHHQTQ